MNVEVGNVPVWNDHIKDDVIEILGPVCKQCNGCLCRGFCESYDMHQHSTKVVRDIVSGLAAFIQSQFISQSSLSQSSSGNCLCLLLSVEMWQLF